MATCTVYLQLYINGAHPVVVGAKRQTKIVSLNFIKFSQEMPRNPSKRLIHPKTLGATNNRPVDVTLPQDISSPFVTDDDDDYWGERNDQYESLKKLVSQSHHAVAR